MQNKIKCPYCENWILPLQKKGITKLGYILFGLLIFVAFVSGYLAYLRYLDYKDLGNPKISRWYPGIDHDADLIMSDVTLFVVVASVLLILSFVPLFYF